MSVGGEAKVDAAQPRSPQGWLTAPAARRITARWLDIVTVLGFAVPVAVYIWFLHHYSLNVVFADQWSDVNLIAASYHGHLTLAALWAQHNENRILFPNLMMLAMSRLDAFNVSAEEYLSAVFLFTAVALIIAAHKRRTPAPWIAYCPVVILMLSVVQAENILWGFQMAWYLVLVALAGVLYVLDRPTLPVVSLVGAMILAVVGSYSSLQGLFIWIAGLLLLFYRRRPAPLMGAWVAAGVLTTVLYLYKFNTNAVASYLTANHFPLSTSIRFYLESLGDVLGVPLRSYGVGADLVTAVGCVILAVALFSLWSGGRRRDPQSAAPVGMALTVFGLVFAFSTTYGRGLGRAGGRFSFAVHHVRPPGHRRRVPDIHRYPAGTDHPRGSARTLSRLVGSALGCLIVLVAVFGLVNGFRWTTIL